MQRENQKQSSLFSVNTKSSQKGAQNNFEVDYVVSLEMDKSGAGQGFEEDLTAVYE